MNTLFAYSTLGSVAEIQTGPFGSQLHAADYVSTGVPSIMPNSIGSRLNILEEKTEKITIADAQRLNKYLVQQNDIIYSRRGDVEKCAFVTPKENGWLCGTGCLRVRFTSERVCPQFCAYYLSTEEIKGWVSGNAVGTTMPNLNTQILQRLPLALPPLAEQQAIAAVLSSLDDKIDLLHRQNKTLEGLAQTLFRQWFVEEADASFKEMPLKDLCLKIESGGTPKREVTEFWGGEIPWLTSGEVREPFVFSTKECITLNGLCGSTAKVWDKGTVVVAMYGATAGVVCYTMIPLSANQACCGLKPKPEYEAFVYFYLSRNSANLAEQATGSAQQNLNKGMIEAHTLLVANADKMLQFQLVAGKQLSMMGKNAKKIRTLTKLRDTLLPKLMSGEVRVTY